MTSNPYAIDSLESFISIIVKLKEEWYSDDKELSPWFRGQEDSSWEMIPRLYRSPDPGDLGTEYEIREEFCRRAPALMNLIDKPSNSPELSSWEWYFLMQHYGAPTRLLDWTEAALIALYFAVKSNRPTDAAVWCLNPWKMNKKVIKTEEVIPPSDSGTLDRDRKRLKYWLPDRFSQSKPLPNLPVALFPTHSVIRIGAQRSCFTLHGQKRQGLEKLITSYIKKITVLTCSPFPGHSDVESLG